MIGRGDRVVCISDDWGSQDPLISEPPAFPKKGRVYKVYDVYDFRVAIQAGYIFARPDLVYLELEEIRDYVWVIEAFRKIEGDKSEWKRTMEKHAPQKEPIILPDKSKETVDACLSATQIPAELPSNTRLIPPCV